MAEDWSRVRAPEDDRPGASQFLLNGASPVPASQACYAFKRSLAPRGRGSQGVLSSYLELIEGVATDAEDRGQRTTGGLFGSSPSCSFKRRGFDSWGFEGCFNSVQGFAKRS